MCVETMDSESIDDDFGCCIRPEFLTAEGYMTDLYFLHRPSDPQVLRRG